MPTTQFADHMIAFAFLVAATIIPLFVHLLLAYVNGTSGETEAARKSLHKCAILISLTVIEIVFGIVHFAGLAH